MQRSSGKALEELLVSAQNQECLTVGVYQSSKVMNADGRFTCKMQRGLVHHSEEERASIPEETCQRGRNDTKKPFVN
ncbi:UNVERIFIED_CONTAM: hypothetical protein FKN15_072868 [Acipenser sinensis]